MSRRSPAARIAPAAVLAVCTALVGHSAMLAAMVVESPMLRVLGALIVLMLAMAEAAGHRLVLHRRGGGQFSAMLLHRLVGHCLMAIALVAGHDAGAASPTAATGHSHGTAELLPPGVLLGCAVLGYLYWTVRLTREAPHRVLFCAEAALIAGMIGWMLLAGGHGAVGA